MNKKGFTLIEIMVTLALTGMLALNLAVPAFLTHVDTAKTNICIAERRVTEDAEQRYFFDEGKHSTSLETLVDNGYIKSIPECPSDGIYAWVSYPEGDQGYQTIMGCSIHWVVNVEGAGAYSNTPPHNKTKSKKPDSPEKDKKSKKGKI